MWPPACVGGPSRRITENLTELGMAVDYRKFCRIDYWNGNTASSEKGEWDRCDVAPLSTYSGYGTQSFTPDEIYRRDALIHLLQQAFEAGERSKLREFQNLLEIKR
jgi:hypothetical protein